jgi:hypothetical protein
MFAVLAFTATPMFATSVQSAASGSDTYLWHGELVALDKTAKTLTVKSMAVGSALEELGRFKAGDRVLLSWSGIDKYANAVNHAVRYDATKKFDERFAFPAEFVSFDAVQRYVTFKAPIPAESISKIESLKAGQWVTATSPHGESSATRPIVAIRGYNDTASNSEWTFDESPATAND